MAFRGQIGGMLYAIRYYDFPVASSGAIRIDFFGMRIFFRILSHSLDGGRRLDNRCNMCHRDRMASK